MALLHRYGILVTYDEVLRFRVYVAKYFGTRKYISRELRMNGTQICYWIDNYDFHTYTPNVKRETHAMTIEFTQQSLNEDEDDTGDSVIIPRVSKTEMKTTKLSKLAPVDVHHYHGLKKPTPLHIEIHQDIYLLQKSKG